MQGKTKEEIKVDNELKIQVQQSEGAFLVLCFWLTTRRKKDLSDCNSLLYQTRGSFSSENGENPHLHQREGNLFHTPVWIRAGNGHTENENEFLLFREMQVCEY